MNRRQSGDTTPCTPWLGAHSRYGYGITGAGRLAHRVAWEERNGPIPAGMVVRHACDNPGCVNVAHLSLGTHADNVADRVARGRSAAGERNGRAKLTALQVAAIVARLADGEAQASLAREYGVSPRAIQWIRKGRNWQSARSAA